MIVDASALTAILFREPDAAALIGAMGGGTPAAVAARPRFEPALVSDKRAGAGMRDVRDAPRTVVRPEMVPFMPERPALAQQSGRDPGRGRRPARHDLGDCVAFARSKAPGEPLSSGEDFARTDIRRAV